MPDLPAANWICHTSSPTSHRTFTRTLGAAEAAFYWDGEFAGTSDIVERTTVAIAPGLVIESPTADAERFRGIWILLKRRFPLLAVRVEELNDGRDLRFVVEESRAVSVQDDGVEFEFVADADENTVKRVLERALNAPERRISPRGAYAAISVLRRPDKDEQGDVVYDVVTHASHAIMDGMASCALVRTFCDTLARWPASLSDPLPDIEDRLRMVPAADSLYPRLPISPARRRWRRAIATVIQTRRSAAMRGGHSLPGLRTATTSRTPAHSRTLRVQLSMAQTAALVASARAHHVSVAHMLPAIIYVALAEVLHRRRGQGGMDDEEWARRIRSVVHVGGPLNIRPFLDREWFENGGANEMNLSIGFWVGQLPHIPSTRRADGQPLITADRFWHLVSRAKDLMTKYYMHPLFFDMAQTARDVRITRGRRAAETWRKLKSGEDVPPAPVDLDAPIFTAIISSMGNMDALLPTEFQSADSETMLQRTRSDLFLRCRPAELYFGSKTLQGVMELYVFYDENTYREDVVREWLDVVREVVTRYSDGSMPTLVQSTYA